MAELNIANFREVELTEADVTNAIIETEKEIAGSPWGDEETEAFDPSGDRSLEEIGEGLEGQHDAGDELGGDDDGEGDGEDETTGTTAPEPVAAKPDLKPEPKAGQTEPAQEPRGMVPSAKLREANERARLAETRLEELARLQNEKLELALREINELKRAPRVEPQQRTEPVVPVKEPDIFEDPQGFVSSLKQTFQGEIAKVTQAVRQQSVALSFELAHVKHQDAFPKAMEAINRLDVNNPDDRATVQRIYNSPNPGEALVGWHRRNETLARVGNDPAAYEERIRTETRQALMSDPEFRKEMIASLRQDAVTGDNGTARTTTRLPRSLARAAGSNVGSQRVAHGYSDDSDQAVADSVWNLPG